MVIAIIGLLAAIIIVALADARNKAKIAKTLAFSASIKRSGINMVGEWRFENTVADSSGNDNNGQIFGGVTWQNSLSQLGQALYLDGGAGNYVQVPNSPSLQQAFSDKSFTFEFWMNTTQSPTPSTELACRWSPGFRVRMWPSISGSGGNLSFDLKNLSGLSLTLYESVKVNDGKWHHIVTVRDTNAAQMMIYVDAVKQAFQDETVGSLASTDLSLTLNMGKPRNPSVAYKGFIDEVRLYSQSLSEAQIQKHYVEGAKKHGLATK